jgi:hypothetical protein
LKHYTGTVDDLALPELHALRRLSRDGWVLFSTRQNPSRPDEYEQTGAGLREPHERFKRATTPEELAWIAAEAERRRGQPGLEPTIETAYAVLASVARKRLTLGASGESYDTAGYP